MRILAMFLVIMTHANFWSLGYPSASEMAASPVVNSFRWLVQCVCAGCVDMFILISGKFSIRFSFKGMGNFLFQVVYFLILGGLAGFLFLDYVPGIIGLKQLLLAVPGQFWFVKAYLAIFILSPVLNTYCKDISKRQFTILLLSYFAFELYFGWLTHSADFILDGFSCFSFVGLYMLARYDALFGIKLKHPGRWWFVTIIFQEACCAIAVWHDKIQVAQMLVSYISPLVIFESFCLLKYFSGLELSHSRVINWISGSCFAVYLLHTCPLAIRNYYKDLINDIWIQYDGLLCLGYIGMVLIGFYVAAILLDQPRKFLWNKLCRCIF